MSRSGEGSKTPTHFSSWWICFNKAQNNYCSCTTRTMKTPLMVSIFRSDLYGAAGHQGNERHQRDRLISCYFTILHNRTRHRLSVGANIISYSIIIPGIDPSALHWVPGCRDTSTGVLDEGPCPCSVNCGGRGGRYRGVVAKSLKKKKALEALPTQDSNAFYGSLLRCGQVSDVVGPLSRPAFGWET